MNAVNGGQRVPQLDEIMGAMMENLKLSATDLLNYFHHLKYEHGLHEDNEGHENRFDEAYDFFKEDIGGNQCDPKHCIFVKMHYRDRSTDKVGDDKSFGVLLETLAMIHCFIFHSYDVNRLTKDEREDIDRKVKMATNARDDEKGADMEKSSRWSC